MDIDTLFDDETVCRVLLTYVVMLTGELESIYEEWEDVSEELESKNQRQIDQLLAKLPESVSAASAGKRIKFVILQIGREIVSKWFEDANLSKLASKFKASNDFVELGKVANEASDHAYNLSDASLPDRSSPSFQTKAEEVVKLARAGRAAQNISYAIACAVSAEQAPFDPGMDPWNEVMDAAIRASAATGTQLEDLRKAQERLMLCVPIIEAAIDLSGD